MNLVRINERLKDLPMQVVQQYANGMNPEVPPYLALGELQRRELSQKQMATAQGGAQGPQPSVKEQVEQKAGLMALQQMQQQQMAQQQAQPRGPMPVPAGVPQPQQQPEATMMARGGLAAVPVQFDFAGGGIVAFNGETGSDVKPKYETRADRLYRENREAAERKKREFDAFNAQISDDPAQVKMREAQQEFESLSPAEKSSERGRRLKEFIKGIFTAPPAAVAQAPMAAPMRPAAPVSRPTSQMTPQQMDSQVKPPAPIADLKTRADQKQRQQGPRPPASSAAPQPGLPAAAAAQPQQDELSRLAMEAVRTPAKAMTPEEAMAQEGKFASQYGLDKKFGEEERGLLALMKQRQADFAKRRPMEELGATLRGFGQGYGGASAAGERAGRETYEMDMANQREMLNAINAINKENLTTGRSRYTTSGNLFGENQKSTAAANQQRGQNLSQMRGQDITAKTAEEQRRTQERGQDIQVQVAKIQAAATREARAQGADDKQIASAEAAFARDPEAAALKKGLEMFALQPNNPKAADIVRRLREIQASKYKQFGITLEGAPSAQSPSGTRPPLSSFQR
jgi:hypothetical protein